MRNCQHEQEQGLLSSQLPWALAAWFDEGQASRTQKGETLFALEGLGAHTLQTEPAIQRSSMSKGPHWMMMIPSFNNTDSTPVGVRQNETKHKWKYLDNLGFGGPQWNDVHGYDWFLTGYEPLPWAYDPSFPKAIHWTTGEVQSSDTTLQCRWEHKQPTWYNTKLLHPCDSLTTDPEDFSDCIST